jgi:hypothetical protein
MTPCDRITIPTHDQAAAAIIRLARGFFDQVTGDPEIALNVSEHFTTWRYLRAFAALFMERKAVILTAEEAIRFRALLDRCRRGPDYDFLFELSFRADGAK